ncbi:MAG: hypothetical protein JWN73_4588 [Betaproteobacteria bacterium]|nr:hypothetical protein [Betaproteobacteria bacterium]
MLRAGMPLHEAMAALAQRGYDCGGAPPGPRGTCARDWHALWPPVGCIERIALEPAPDATLARWKAWVPSCTGM